jgi:hypothetical protein
MDYHGESKLEFQGIIMRIKDSSMAYIATNWIYIIAKFKYLYSGS